MFVATADKITSSMKDRPEILHILSVDGCIEENGVNHQTKNYEIMQQGTGLVVRRGQSFYLNVKLNRHYNPRSDSINMNLKMEVEQNIYPKNNKIPQVVVPLLNNQQLQTCWIATVNSVNENSIKIKVNIPTITCVGKYHIQFDTFTKTTPPSNFTIDECLYIIFNPWCPDDKVYLNNQEHRQEYVMAEDGLIWTGHASQMKATPWSFRQFNKDVLDTAFHLINVKSNVDVVDRHDPIYVSRALSALVNGDDYDEGILLGKWDGNYADGKHPQSWLGSNDIIQKYLKEKKSVKYGQCWVYAGVFASLCRALGIPCRVVTNYESAHDTNDNLQVERCFDYEGEEIYNKEFRGHSVWNFHVWNEIWMTRYDLYNKEFHGWQVIDTTPQGASTRNNSYRSQYTCGPFPVTAIKLGELDIPFNAEFIFGEINADVCYFKKNNDNDIKMFDKVDRLSVGQHISTKAVGSYKREDITDTYKFPKGSIDSRKSIHKFHTYCGDVGTRNADCPASNFNNITFNLDATNYVVIGQPFSIFLSMKNDSDQTYDVSTKIMCNAVHYTGKKIHLVNGIKADVNLGPLDVKTVKLNISWADYQESLKSTSLFNIVCLSSVPAENYDYFGDLNIQLIKPTMNINAKALVSVNEGYHIAANFRNPLPIQLTNAQFSILAPGLEKSLKIKLGSPVGPGTNVTCNFTCTARKKEECMGIINFQSDELNGVQEFLAIKVVENASITNDSTCDKVQGSSAIFGATGQPTMGLFSRFLQRITCNLLIKNK